MIKLKYEELCEVLTGKLIKYNFQPDRAELCASIFATNNLYGVASHGTNRFVAFIKLINLGFIDPNAEPVKVNSFGALEQWDGKSGPGPLNALSVTDRAIDLAAENGLGCVALKNANHWMRAGAFGWHAAEKGFILIAFTNAFPMMPPWGSKEPAIGNNPLCIAVPRENGHIVLDMAMSRYSYGQLSTHKRANKELPFEAGYDNEGNLTKDPAVVYENRRVLPIGFWKGSGLSIVFDLIATVLSGGKASHELIESGHDTGMSQVFIAIDPGRFANSNYINNTVDEIIRSIKDSAPAKDSDEILYPGERALSRKEMYLKDGIPVEDLIWQRIIDL